jgi:hypothetical protein
MNNFPFDAWLEKTAKYPGVFAGGVRLANRTSGVRSYHESFAEGRVGELLQCVTEVAFHLRNSQLGGGRLRWVFENGQLHSARRPDGTIAVLLTNKDANVAAAVEELFTDFLSDNAAAN